MKFSFVIPAHNEEKRIGQCVDSILHAIEATMCDAEVVVVDNASGDCTAKVASSRPGVRVVEEPRKGLLFARQKGFEAATGDLVACIDADSLLSPGWIDAARHAFARSPRIVCLSGPYVYYDLSSAANLLVMMWYFVTMVIMAFIGQYILGTTAMLQGGNYVVRRSALEKIGGYNTAITFYGEDIDLACRLAKVGHILFLFRFRLKTSGRRIRKEGFFATGIRYAANGLYVALLGRPVSHRYTDIRES